jgi:hypothetical protein
MFFIYIFKMMLIYTLVAFCYIVYFNNNIFFKEKGSSNHIDFIKLVLSAS